MLLTEEDVMARFSESVQRAGVTVDPLLHWTIELYHRDTNICSHDRPRCRLDCSRQQDRL